MLIPSHTFINGRMIPSLSRRVNANSQRMFRIGLIVFKLIKKGEC